MKIRKLTRASDDELQFRRYTSGVISATWRGYSGLAKPNTGETTTQTENRALDDLNRYLETAFDQIRELIDDGCERYPGN